VPKPEFGNQTIFLSSFLSKKRGEMAVSTVSSHNAGLISDAARAMLPELQQALQCRG